ncbi:MAG: mechanosensitive ion channel family protein [Campylobacterota bacterium]|nr:mechanosensitive ion channel family protein [Campylobacterota bacterium]
MYKILLSVVLLAFLSTILYGQMDLIKDANEELQILHQFGLVLKIDSYLEVINLSTIKLLLMLIASIILFISKNYLYTFINKNIHKIPLLNKYSKHILDKAKNPIAWILSIINIQIIIYIFNDFNAIVELNKVFNILYIIFLTMLVYRVANTITNIKLKQINANHIKKEVVNVSIKIANFMLIIFGLLLSLYFAGVDLTAVLSGLGIGGFAVALAAKDSLANFFGTLSILFSDTFSQGDWIVVDGVEGTVVEIGLRATKIRTFDNAMITVPNQTLANGEIKNWNKRVLGRRIKMSLGIKYDSKSDDIYNAVKDIKTMLLNHTDIATQDSQHNDAYHSHSAKLISVDDAQGVKRTLLVFLDEFSDSSINILVYCFSKTVNWDEWLAVKEDVMYKIMQIFEKNNLEFAFPSLSLYHENKNI